MKKYFNLVSLLSLLVISCLEEQKNTNLKTIWLHDLDLLNIQMGWPIPPHINENVKGDSLSVGDQVYKHGVWMNSNCIIPIVLSKSGIRFSAYCGTDDLTRGSYHAEMEFFVIVDQDTAFRSGVMSAGVPAKEVDIDLKGVDTLWLVLDDYDGNVGNDQGDWLDAKIEYYGEQKPYVFYDKNAVEADMPNPKNGYDAFYPGKSWYDTEGRKIQGHEGMVTKFGDTYYWYGKDMSLKTKFFPKCRVDVIGGSCYTSKDLYNWKNEGLVIEADDSDTMSAMHPKNLFGRPKVIYNAKTDKYVMWAKADNATSQWGHVLVAVADDPLGPFEPVWQGKPDGKKFGDATLFQDREKAYLIWSCGACDESTEIYELTDDYLNIKQHTATTYVEAKREAPVVFKDGDTYFMITSGKSGWSPNPLRYATASSMKGPWQDKGEFFVGEGNETSFRSQCTGIFKHNGQWILMGDRWNQRDLGDSRYIWLPIQKEGDELSVVWKESWKYK